MLKFGLLGEKLGHSLSPLIHSLLWEKLGRCAEYTLEEVTAQDLPSKFKNFGQEFSGLNVTIPYKTTVMPWLDQIEPAALAIGAVNTIKWVAGQSYGYNTDYYGFGRLLAANNIKVAQKQICVLGSGGAAQAVVKYLLDQQALRVVVVARQQQEAAGRMQHLASPERLLFTSYAALPSTSLIVINCTPVGMYPQIEATPLSQKDLAQVTTVVDLIYNPAETLLLREARLAGKQAVNGLLMLVAQAAAAEEIWLGEEFSTEIIEQVTEEVAGGLR
ncbi:MAG TPA: shikimate dehydrogenase [Candidatus Avacidaminococcus intestinavium]|uniref:Shikimate dehydrogenase (NADP(+)) n=1 Tax=Candidatus Avacidaminococcus intestinavium TaxID=2840684 RepID=A0A9D1MPX4_9FIRM|nr:shikimate dehydrogenase [Candidatus Avacidaminococcus intestinavium]